MKSRRSRIWIVCAAAGLVATLIAALIGRAILTPSAKQHPLRAALPTSATIVHQEQTTYGPLQIFYLKAAMPEAAFTGYVESMNLSRYTPAPDDAFQGWRQGKLDPSWWTPPQAIEGTFTRETEKNWFVAKHDGKFLWAFCFDK